MKDKVIDVAEALRNPGKVFQLVEEQGHIVVTEDGQPRYMIIDLEKEPQIEMTENEKLEFVAQRILREHHGAFAELAKGSK